MKPKKLDIYEPMRRVDPRADEIVQRQVRQFVEKPQAFHLSPIVTEGARVCDCCFEPAGKGHQKWCAYAPAE